MTVYRCSTGQQVCFVVAKSARSAARKGRKRLGKEVSVQAWSNRLSDLMDEAWATLTLEDRLKVVVQENARLRRQTEYLQLEVLVHQIEHGHR